MSWSSSIQFNLGHAISLLCYFKKYFALIYCFNSVTYIYVKLFNNFLNCCNEMKLLSETACPRNGIYPFICSIPQGFQMFFFVLNKKNRQTDKTKNRLSGNILLQNFQKFTSYRLTANKSSYLSVYSKQQQEIRIYGDQKTCADFWQVLQW